MKTNMLSQKIREYINDHKRKKIWKKAMFVMSIMTIFCITFILIRPALTMENNPLTDITEEETEIYVSEEVISEEIISEEEISEEIISEEEISEEEMLNWNNQIMLLSAFLTDNYNGINWEISPAVDGGYRLVLSTDSDTTAVIPSDFFEKSGLSGYKGSISNVYLGAGITAVGDNAFSDSEQLRTVEFAEGSQLNSIGLGAFYGCTKLSNVNLEACTGLETLGKDSFNGTNLVKIEIPNSVSSIGDCAFYGCTNLNTVDFQPNTSLVDMGAFVFAKCTSLETINLENLTGENLNFGIKQGNFDNIENANGMFYGCTALKSLTLPNMSGSIAAICKGCESIMSINLDNCNKLQCNDSTGNNNFANFIDGCNNLEELNLSKVTGMTTLFQYIVGGGVKKVTFPPTLSKINGHVFQSTNVEEVVFKMDKDGKSQLVVVENTAFSDAKKLKEIDLQFADTGNPYLGDWAFSGCTDLEKITISRSEEITIGSMCFTTGANFRELIWNVKSVTNDTIYTLVDENTSKDIHFTVGKNVEKLPSGLIENLKNNISGYSFEPNHSFYIDRAVEGTPFKIAGCYYADADGNLYRLNASTDPPSAELVYVNHRGEGELVIPSEFTNVIYYNNDGSIDTSGKTFVVKKICSDAFKDTAYTSITFEHPENITVIEDRAFAGAYNLVRINGKISEEEIKVLFQSVTFGNDVFAGTFIKSNPFSGINTGEAVQFVIKEEGKPFSYPSFAIHENENLVQISVESISVLDGLKEKCVLATGETANLKIGISNNLSEKKTRVYIKLSDGDSGTVTPPQGEILTPLGNGIYYYDVPKSIGKAFSKNISITYPNGVSPNKKAYIWLVETNDGTGVFPDNKIIYPKETAEGFTASDKYLEVTWDVLPEEYFVKKTENSITPVIKTEDNNVHIVENLSFQVSNEIGSREENIGADYVNYITYEDTLTLPSGISLRERLLDAIKIKNYTAQINENKHGGIITVKIGDVNYTLCTLNLNTEILRDISCEVTDDNKNFKIIWSTENQVKNSQITDAKTTITYGNDVIIIAEDTKEKYTFENYVKATPCYIYNGPKDYAEATASRDVTQGNPNLIIKKEWVKKPKFMGENAVYKISVDNNSLTEHTGVVEIYDDFGEHQYLTPETIQEMFTAPEYDGNNLTIEIKNAVLMPTNQVVKEVTAADGRTRYETSVNNTANHNLYSGLEKEYNPAGKKTDVVIIIRKVDNVIHISTGDSDILVNNNNIQAALDSLGYIVTANDKYVAHWDFPETTVLTANYHKDYIINATVKNSLQALGEDMSTSISSINTSFSYEVKNRLRTSYGNTSNVSDTSMCNPGCDLYIYKTAIVGNKSIDEDHTNELADSIRNGDTVISYNLNIDHYGTGKYGLLPVVDHMSGVQAVLALKSDNLNPEWAGHCGTYKSKDDKEYYVLNQNYTYEGVYLENAYADSITVKKTETGLDTLIKWYYIDETGSEYDIVPTYNAIFSQDYAGNENTKASYFINNEAWVNDLPTHRIYSTIGAQGTSITFKKQIVTVKGDNPDNDKIWTSELPYPVSSAGQNITYRLEFNNNGGALSLNGSEIYDELPETSGFFNWSKDDVKIFYKASNGDITVKNGETNLLASSDGTEFSVIENKIIWDEIFKIEFPAIDSRAYIYVTLKFPKGEIWLDYVNANKNTILHNTLYFHEVPSQVSHTLPAAGTAMLRKGVYETGYYVINENAPYNNKNKQYFRGKNRFNYVKNSENAKMVKNTVTYFVVLHNSGETNLYLSSIYDQLPEGFTFYTMVSTPYGTNDTWTPRSGTLQFYQGMPNSIGLTLYGDGYFVKPKVSNSKLIEWYPSDDPNHRVNTTVVESVKNKQMLKFDVVIDDEHKDDIGYFLKPNEAIQFGYMCYTGNENIPKAVNSCAMEYLDYSLAGIELPENTDINVSTRNGIYNENNGEAEIWNNETAEKNGFTVVNEKNLAGELKGDSFRKWLASSVKLTEGEITPGITKSVENYYVKKDKPAIWKIKSENSGTNAMTNYTIDDVMQYPFVFTGKVKYNIYSNKPNTEYFDANYNFNHVAGSGENENDYLFEISSMDENGVTLISNKNETTTLKYGKSEDITVSIDVKKEENSSFNVKINICFTKNEKNAYIMSIRFEDPVWSIPTDGYSELILQTAIPETFNDPDGIYENKAIITPAQTWNEKDVTNGKVSDDKKSLSNTASVSIYSSYATASYKEISAENKYGVSANYQDKGDKPDFITINNKNAEITYTLNVSSADSDMGELILIDNLPQVGDTSPINDDIARNSQFKVKFANDPKVEVYFVTANGTETPKEELLIQGNETNKADYTVQYSSKTSNFDNNTDWTGGGTEWHDELNNQGDRSIRIHITKKLPQGTIAKVIYKAFIDTNVTDSNEAEAGEYAWSSFAYNFIANEGSSMWLHAAPLNVGLGIPSIPSIEKKLVKNHDHKILAEAEETCTFRFIVYEGDEKSFTNYDETTIVNALINAGKKYFTVDATVNQGASTSERIVLKPTDDVTNWSWIHDKPYTIVELDSVTPDSEKENYTFGYIENEHSSKRSYTFKYDTTKNQLITVANVKQEKAYELPMTGGGGTYLFTICGLLLMAGGVYGIMQKRKNYMNK